MLITTTMRATRKSLALTRHRLARSPESVEILLPAGAAVDDVAFPSGYAPVDELLRFHKK
jgi:hypothetical protein